MKGVIISTLKNFSDPRGFFRETFRETYDFGEKVHFVQDNVSFSRANVLRGLHYQRYNAQAQLLTVISGKIFDVLLDLRLGSPSFRKYQSFILDANEGPNQIYMPAGIAHGFYVLSEGAYLHYKCSKYYDPASEGGIIWSDDSLRIPWPLANNKPIVSSKDHSFRKLSEITDEEFEKILLTTENL